MRNNGIFGACDDFPADNITPVRPVGPTASVPAGPITDFYPVSDGGNAQVPSVNITPVERVPETARPIGMTASTGTVVGMTAGGGTPIGMSTGGGSQVGMSTTPWIVPNMTRSQVSATTRAVAASGFGAVLTYPYTVTDSSAVKELMAEQKRVATLHGWGIHEFMYKVEVLQQLLLNSVGPGVANAYRRSSPWLKGAFAGFGKTLDVDIDLTGVGSGAKAMMLLWRDIRFRLPFMQAQAQKKKLDAMLVNAMVARSRQLWPFATYKADGSLHGSPDGLGAYYYL